MKEMTPREKMLGALVAGVVFVLLNIVLLSSFLKKQAQSRIDLAGKIEEWKTTQVLLSERELWLKRDDWLQKKQQKLANEGSAGVELLDFTKDIAKKNEVILENPAIGTLDKSPFHRAVPVNIETKSPGPALIHFLQTMQQPEQFIVFETANIAIDPSDASMMRGKFRIARWYAP
jgi:hypothetical protein